MKALFICTGNSCRSVMAEYLFRRFAAERGHPEWESRSCGIAAQHYFATPEGVRKALARYDVAEVNHTAKLVGRPNMAWATHVFPMAMNHLEVLHELYPEHHAKISLFLESAGMGQKDVADPIGKPVEKYIECCDIIAEGLKAILDRAEAKTP